MNTKMSKRQRDLKAKLMAAIAMLLVSSIMMVSTTYAWFTLSTAPEVTGITTAVGANGNLEMALLPPNATPSDLKVTGTLEQGAILSGVGDSRDATGQTIAEANVTWGNLVDLADVTMYGMDKISLYPSALNYRMADGSTTTPYTDEDGFKYINGNPLSRPVYGVDGRVTELKSSDVFSNIYASGAFNVGGTQYYGVRAVGTASSMAPRQAEHRSVVQAAAANTNNAKTNAYGSLKENGGELAGLAVKKANKENEFTKAEVQSLLNTVAKLNDAIGNLELAIKNYVVAHNIGPAAADAEYQAIKTRIMGMTLPQLNAAADVAKPAPFDTAFAKLYTVNAEGAVTGGVAKDVADAKAGLENLLTGNGPFEWTAFSGFLTKIMDPDKMLLNGFTMTQVRADEDGDGEYDNMDELVQSVLKNKIQITMPAGSGAYATVAEFCGDYTAPIVLPAGLKVEGIALGGTEATMKTASIGSAAGQVATPYLVTMNTSKNDYVAAAGTGTVSAITDFYGYIIDLAFRTNVANSQLRLQTEGVNRVYSDSANEALQGGGATMTFTSAAEGFNATSITNLMEHIRIVFFDPSNNKILAEARLDTANADVESETQVTADIKIHENAANMENDADIVTLEQNKATPISVLVYLDGETIQNEDVANGMQSVTGTMNLQFSSSATLDPMDYTALKEGGTATTTVVTTDMKTVNIATDAAQQGVKLVTGRLVTDTATNTSAVAVVLQGVPEGYDVQLAVGTNGPATATSGVYAGYRAYGIEVGSDVTADTAVTVSLVANTNTDSGSDSDGDDDDQGTTTTYTVTVPEGVSGATTATAGTAYSFTVAEGKELTGVTINDVSYSEYTNEGNVYTIPGAAITGNIVITVAENA